LRTTLPGAFIGARQSLQPFHLARENLAPDLGRLRVALGVLEVLHVLCVLVRLVDHGTHIILHSWNAASRFASSRTSRSVSRSRLSYGVASTFPFSYFPVPATVLVDDAPVRLNGDGSARLASEQADENPDDQQVPSVMIERIRCRM
jgi:hypothetical protein